MLDYTKFSDYDHHQTVIELDQPQVGLSGYIAIHNTNLGPAVGGTRIFAYASKEQALRDALRLSRAMTYKCAIAKLPYGGGKGVIILDPKYKTKDLLKAYAEYVQGLGGMFFTGEDVGLSEGDVQYMLQTSNYFIGKTGQAGDPSAYAALSVFKCIQATLEFLYGDDSLQGKRVAIKGLGKTGRELLELLHAQGAKIVVAEIHPEIISTVKEKYPDVEFVAAEQIAHVECDVYAPCALGDEFSHKSVDVLRAKIICGTANNQLETPEVGTLLYKKGITYVPDYLANAGGLIDVADELEQGGYNRERVLERIDLLKAVCKQVIVDSQKNQLGTNFVADRMAEQFIREKLLNFAQHE